MLVKAAVGLKVERSEVSECRDRLGPILKARRKHAVSQNFLRIKGGRRATTSVNSKMRTWAGLYKDRHPPSLDRN